MCVLFGSGVMKGGFVFVFFCFEHLIFVFMYVNKNINGKKCLMLAAGKNFASF